MLIYLYMEYSGCDILWNGAFKKRFIVYTTFNNRKKMKMPILAVAVRERHVKWNGMLTRCKIVLAERLDQNLFALNGNNNGDGRSICSIVWLETIQISGGRFFIAKQCAGQTVSVWRIDQLHFVLQLHAMVGRPLGGPFAKQFDLRLKKTVFKDNWPRVRFQHFAHLIFKKSSFLI